MIRRQSAWIAVAAITLSGAVSATAQQQQQGQQRQQQQQQRQQQPQLQRVSQLVGTDVQTQDGQRVGTIENLAIDPQSGKTIFVVVSTEDVRELAGKQLAVPIRAVRFGTAREAARLNVSMDRLRNAPEFAGGWETMADPEWSRVVHEFYGVEPETTMGGGADQGAMDRGSQAFPSDNIQTYTGRIISIDRGGARDGQGAVAVTLDTNQGQRTVHLAPSWFLEDQGVQLRTNDRIEVRGASANVRGQRVILATELETDGRLVTLRDEQTGRPHWAGARGRGGQQGGRADRGQGQRGQAARLSTENLVPATEAIGMEISDRQREQVGQVEDLIFETNRRQIVYALIDPAQQVAAGDQLLVIPWEALDFNRAENMFVVNTNRNRLRNAPTIMQGQVQQLADAQFSQDVHEFYGTEPGFAYGFVQPGGPQSRGWHADSRYNRMFAPNALTTIRGQVMGYERFTPMEGMAEGRLLRVRTDDGRSVNIHLGPAWFVEPQRIQFREGDQVQVRGSRVEIDGQPAIIATQVLLDDNVLVLRSPEGTPLWDATRSVDRFRGRQRDMDDFFDGDDWDRDRDRDRDRDDFFDDFFDDSH